MHISVELPQDIEQELRTNGADLNGEAREAYLVNLYREDRITHHQLAQALGLSRLETEGVLKRYQVSSGVTADEMRVQAVALQEGLPETRQ
jgi:predicted HTH domain antitoxin